MVEMVGALDSVLEEGASVAGWRVGRVGTSDVSFAVLVMCRGGVFIGKVLLLSSSGGRAGPGDRGISCEICPPGR